jgi:hypothetical protein
MKSQASLLQPAMWVLGLWTAAMLFGLATAQFFA